VTRLWDDVCYHVWLSSADTVIRTSGASLSRLDKAGTATSEKIRFTLFGARVANLLNEDILLAPLGVAVIPLPHQLRALRRATSQDRIRVLLADEVGHLQSRRSLGGGGTPIWLDFPERTTRLQGASGDRERGEGTQSQSQTIP